jgi:flavin reductase (DIM6/NTAB) family NADH-FMN oxidoreductase RutF
MSQELNWKEAVTLASPYPYLLVTSVDKEGKPNAMGIGWWSFTSMNPPLFLVSVGKGRHTLECIKHTKDFVACFPGESIAKGAWVCGTKSGRDCDKLAEAGLSTIPAKKVKAPIIEGSTVAFECKVTDEIETGDHVVFVGEIVAMSGDPEKPMHLYSIFYNRLVSMDTEGNRNFTVDYK